MKKIKGKSARRFILKKENLLRIFNQKTKTKQKKKKIKKIKRIKKIQMRSEKQK